MSISESFLSRPNLHDLHHLHHSKIPLFFQSLIFGFGLSDSLTCGGREAHSILIVKNTEASYLHGVINLFQVTIKDHIMHQSYCLKNHLLHPLFITRWPGSKSSYHPSPRTVFVCNRYALWTMNQQNTRQELRSKNKLLLRQNKMDQVLCSSEAMSATIALHFHQNLHG